MSTAAPLQNRPAKWPSMSTLAHRGLLLQRKCACGSPTQSMSGECAECQGKKLQRSPLAIGAPDDRFEQEADRVADAVVAGKMASLSLSPVPIANVQREDAPQQEIDGENFTDAGGKKIAEQAPKVGGDKKATPSAAEKYWAETARLAAADGRLRTGMTYKPGSAENLQQKAEQRKKEDEPALQRKLVRTISESTANSAVPPIVHEVLHSLGQPLDAETRAFMEPRFGHDFARVRVHSGAAAGQSAREVDANAYTVGNNIVFGAGRFAPGTHEGRRLLAHELTHVVQQRDHVSFDGYAQGHSGTLYRQIAPQPKKNLNLALYQWPGKDKQFFKDLASTKTNEIGAKAFPTEDEGDNPYICPDTPKTAPIPFNSGAEIVNAIRNAYFCADQKVSQVHIFSHSWNSGIFGVDTNESKMRGLYSSRALVQESDIAQGARAVSDIPAQALKHDAAFVMHGCGTAGGSDSFAQRLLAAIIGSSPQARVYGHSAKKMCGSEDDWMEFSTNDPGGKSINVNPFHKPSKPSA